MITYPISSNLCKKCSLQCYQIYNFPSFSSSNWKSSVKKFVLGNFAKFTGKHLWQSLFLGDCFWSFSCLFLKISCLLHCNRKNEMKKGKYPDGVQMFTFFLDYRFAWRQKFHKKFDRWLFNQKMCLKRIWYCNFHGWRNFAREKFLGSEHVTSSSTKTA